MKGFTKISMLFTVAVTALLISSCAGEKETVKGGILVPQDAQVAIKLDVMSVWEKAVDEDNEMIQELLGMAEAFMDGVDIKNDYGLDIEKPVILSGVLDIEDESGDVYLSVSVSDKAKLVEAIDGLVDMAAMMDVEIEKSSLATGQDLYVVDYYELEYPVYVAVDKTSAVIYLSVDTYNDGKDALEALYSQDSCPAYEGFDAFVKASDDLTLWVASDVFVDELMDVFYEDPSMAELVENFMPDMDMFEGSSTLLGLNFYDGKTVLNYASYASEELAAYSGKFMGTASDKYFHLIPENACVAANIALANIGSAFDSIMENEEIADAFDALSFLGIDEDIFDELPGTITLAIAENALNSSSIPEFTLAVECGEKIYSILENFVLRTYATKEGDAYNVLDICYVSYVDDAIVAMSPTLWAASSEGEGLARNFKNNPISSEIESNGVMIDLDSVSEDLMCEIIDDPYIDKDVITDFVSSIVFSTGKNLEGTLTLNMGDKEHNLLEKVVELALEELY